MIIALTFPQGKSVAEAMAQAPAAAQVALGVFVQKSTIYLQGLVRAEEPVRTGRMRNATNSAFNGLEGRVRVDTNYALYVHQGTGLYAIDRSLTTGRIKNGGIKPNQFVDRAVASGRPTVNLYFEQAGDAILKSVTG